MTQKDKDQRAAFEAWHANTYGYIAKRLVEHGGKYPPNSQERFFIWQAAIAHDRQQHEHRTDADRAAAQTLADLTALIPLKDMLPASASCGDLVGYFKGLIDRQHRGEAVGVSSLRSCAIADSNYAAGMLLGWNLCVDGDNESFSRIREDRMRAAAQASREAKAEDAAPQPAAPANCERQNEQQNIHEIIHAAAEPEQ